MGKFFLPVVSVAAFFFQSEPIGEWANVGSVGGRKYSHLQQIDKTNVSRLKSAWTYSTGDLGTQDNITGLKVSPIVVGTNMYLCAASGKIISLDAATGIERWVFDPGVRAEDVHVRACRGVSFWKSSDTASGNCVGRIFSAIQDGRLVALDSETGTPCSEFGDRGFVDLQSELGLLKPGEVTYTAPPLVYSKGHESVVVVNSSNQTGLSVTPPSGVIRAYDPLTGKKVWNLELLPDDFNKEPYEALKGPEYGQFVRGTPNSWGTMTADPSTNQIFIPVGQAHPDYFIGDGPPGLTDLASNLVAVNPKTGLINWRHATCLNCAWDLDLASQPVLAEIEFEQRTRQVVIQATKGGVIYVLDRMTGEPLTPHHRFNVPSGGVESDKLSSYQLDPTFIPGLDQSDQLSGSSVTSWHDEIEKSFGVEAAKYCRNIYATARNEGRFTPVEPGAGSIVVPGVGGGANWGGAAFSEKNQILTVNFLRLPSHITVLDGNSPECRGHFSVTGGKSYCLKFNPAMRNRFSPHLPCSPPPWGKMVAYDLRSRKVLWENPLGEVMGLKGFSSVAGNIITASGLIFVGNTFDSKFRALDLSTGKVLWSAQLEAPAMAVPITYSISGVQYVGVAAGGDQFSPHVGDKIEVFTLQ